MWLHYGIENHIAAFKMSTRQMVALMKPVTTYATDILELGLAPLSVEDPELERLFQVTIDLTRKTPKFGSFGNESCHAFLLSEGGIGEFPELARRYLLRPGIEPIILSYQPLLDSKSFTTQSYIDLASALSLKSARLRMSEEGKLALDDRETIVSTSRLSPEFAVQKIISFCVHSKEIDVYSILSLLVSTIIHQPLRDANSRTANALLNIAIMSAFDLAGPAMSVGPSFVVRPHESFAALFQLYENGNWQPFVTLFKQALSEGIQAKLTRTCSRLAEPTIRESL
jgi:hypothetical protein